MGSRETDGAQDRSHLCSAGPARHLQAGALVPWPSTVAETRRALRCAETCRKNQPRSVMRKVELPTAMADRALAVTPPASQCR